MAAYELAYKLYAYVIENGRLFICNPAILVARETKLAILNSNKH